MSSLLVFYRVYVLEVESVMFVFLTIFVNYWPSNLLSGSPPPQLSPFQSKSTVYTLYRQCVAGGGGMFSCAGDHNLQKFNILFAESTTPKKNLGGDGASVR